MGCLEASGTQITPDKVAVNNTMLLYLVLDKLHHGILVVEESILLLHAPVDGSEQLAITRLREVMGLQSRQRGRSRQRGLCQRQRSDTEG